MKDFDTEELKTTIGCIMLDLRGNCGWDYEERIKIIQECLERLLKENPENKDFKSDLELCKSAIDEIEYKDGRIFRGCGKLYGYSSKEGKTTKVWKFLQECLTYPDNNNFKL